VLDKGVVQQVASPQELYHHPTNTFVASFIGSPPMNFLRGTLDAGAVLVSGYRLELPDQLRQRVGSSARDVLVGLRPEHFEAAVGNGNGATVLPADVEVTEQLGPETYAYFRVEGLDVVEIGERPVELAKALTARLDPRTSVEPGQRLGLAVEPTGIRLFDAESGEALTAQAP
jgi:multiple sugar transport system ATP-binding protein